MSQSHTIVTGSGPAAVLDLVARIVLDENVAVGGWAHARPGSRPPLAPAAPVGADAGASEEDRAAAVIDELVDAAVANSQRLAIASRFWMPEDHRGAQLAQIMIDAVTLGLASSAAVNVAATMVGAVAAGAEAEVAHTVVKARSVLADDDLIAGAAALMTALTYAIARALDLDPAHVEFELRNE